MEAIYNRPGKPCVRPGRRMQSRTALPEEGAAQ